MRATQIHLSGNLDLEQQLAPLAELSPDLILVFGAVSYFKSPHLAKQLQQLAPSAAIIGCSTAGEIAGNKVYDDSCVVTCVTFAETRVHITSTPLNSMTDSYAAGLRLGRGLPSAELTGVLVLATGVNINGSALIEGLRRELPAHATISGGLAADAGAFSRTWTLGPEGASDRHLVALGFYGSQLQLSYGTFGGWEAFGPMRKVTRCQGNILYELDGERALDVYMRYLGDYARDLPGSGLLFPFAMFNSQQEKLGVLRTILSVYQQDGSLTLAGEIDPEGYLALMHASTDKLINGAETAAFKARIGRWQQPEQSLAILISCIGRKLVMGDRIDEEVETVAHTLGANTCITGYYSNGEIAGTEFNQQCQLHNQTMTITWISEN